MHCIETSEGLAFILALMAGRRARQIDIPTITAPDSPILRQLISKPSNAVFLPVLGYSLRANCIAVSTDVQKCLGDAYARQFVRYSRHCAISDEIAQSFRQSQVPFRFFKGRENALRLYPQPELRCSCDIDVIVYPAFFHQAQQVMLRNGWQCISRLPLHDTYIRNSTVVELHRHLFGPGERVIYGVDTSEIISFIDKPDPYFDYILLALRLFSEPSAALNKILDLYLFEQVFVFETARLQATISRWNAGYALTIARARVDFYSSSPVRGNRRFFAMYAWRNQWLWKRIRYFTLLVHCRHPGCIMRKLLLARDADSEPKTLRWYLHCIFVFLGLRRLDLRYVRMKHDEG